MERPHDAAGQRPVPSGQETRDNSRSHLWTTGQDGANKDVPNPAARVSRGCIPLPTHSLAMLPISAASGAAVAFQTTLRQTAGIRLSSLSSLPCCEETLLFSGTPQCF
jgi:hypothetical protein